MRVGLGVERSPLAMDIQVDGIVAECDVQYWDVCEIEDDIVHQPKAK